MQRLAIALAVMRREFRDLLANRALLLSMVATVGLAVLFVRLGERAQASQSVRVAVVGQGQGMLMAELGLTGVLRFHVAPSREAAEREVRDGRVDLALLLPGTLEEDVRRGERPAVGLLTRRDAGPRTLVGITAVTEWLRVKAGQAPPFVLQVDAVGAPDTEVRLARSVSGWVLFALMMGMTVVAASLVEEREKGTLQAVLVTRARLGSVLLGKGAYGFLLCLVAAVGITLGCGCLGTDAGARLLVLGGGACFGTCLGLLLGSLFPNLASANAGLSLAFLVLFVPVLMAELLQGTPLGGEWTRVLPSRVLHDGLLRILAPEEEGGRALSTVGTLGAWSLVSAGASWAFMRAELES